MIKGNAQVVCPFAKGGLLCNRFRNASLVNSSWTPGYFIHASITTPIASALKNYYPTLPSISALEAGNKNMKRNRSGASSTEMKDEGEGCSYRHGASREIVFCGVLPPLFRPPKASIILARHPGSACPWGRTSNRNRGTDVQNGSSKTRGMLQLRQNSRL